MSPNVKIFSKKITIYLKSFFNILIGIIIGFPLVICGLLYYSQDNMIFRKSKIDPLSVEGIRKEFPNSEVVITTPDNVKIKGWYIKNNAEKKMPLLIYFGGNAEEVSTMLWDAHRFKGWAVLLMNYRGYGLSEGKPSERNLYRDALTIYDHFSKRPDINRNKIVVLGRSLGTGVGVYLASKRPLAGIILISPYDSIRSISQEMYPYIPVRLILKHPFDSLSRASSIIIPMLAVISSGDEAISPAHSQNLVRNWGGPNTVYMVDGLDHNSIMLDQDLWKRMIKFLDSL